jgi:hypothetical protein
VEVRAGRTEKEMTAFVIIATILNFLGLWIMQRRIDRIEDAIRYLDIVKK